MFRGQRQTASAGIWLSTGKRHRGGESITVAGPTFGPLPVPNQAGEQDLLLPVGGGLLVNNMGLFRLREALSLGWKPGIIEDHPARKRGLHGGATVRGRVLEALESYGAGAGAAAVQVSDPGSAAIGTTRRAK